MELDDLYPELILDHFRNPRCRGSLENPGASCSLKNPLCGDIIELGVKLSNSQLTDVAYTGQGCSISQASASMMAEMVKGKSIVEVRKLVDLFKAMMHGQTTDQDLSLLGDAIALEGVKKFTARIRCALLAWEALERCLSAATQCGID